MPICATYITPDDIPITFDRETKILSITLCATTGIAELLLVGGAGNPIGRVVAPMNRVTHVNYGWWPIGNMSDSCTVSVLTGGEAHIIYEREGDSCPV